MKEARMTRNERAKEYMMFDLSRNFVICCQTLVRILMIFATVTILMTLTAGSSNNESGSVEGDNVDNDYELITEYDRWPIKASIDDIVFIPVPEASELDDIEYYILNAYAQDNPWGTDIAWWLEVAGIAVSEYWITGILPESLTEELIIWHMINPDIVAVDDLEEEDQNIVQYYRNPITGNYSTYDEPELSPGNFYLRVLSDEEIMSIADIDARIAYICSGEKCSISRWHYQDDISEIETLATPPIYVRVYGNDQVLLTTLYYGIFSSDDFACRFPMMLKKKDSEKSLD